MKQEETEKERTVAGKPETGETGSRGREPENMPAAKEKSDARDWMESILFAGALFLLLFFFCFPTRISGPSMRNTLQDGDRVSVSRFLALTHQYEAGDIIVFGSEARGTEEDFIKRIIGLPGDEVTIAQGCVAVNGVILTEDYAYGETEGELSVVVPEGCLFVLGDNRPGSMDSRYFGVIDQSAVKSKVLFRWYPFGSLTWLG